MTANTGITLPQSSESTRLHLLGQNEEQLRAWLAERKQPAYRAKQILQWLYAHRARQFEEMSNLSKALRADLAEACRIHALTIDQERVSEDGTRKLLLRGDDQALVETVWIPSGERHTVCISSQVGCPVGCRFCASGTEGLERNLTTGEIVEQAVRIRDLVQQQHGPQARLTNIVMMGMGEPLANYRNMIAALRILNADWGLHIGARKITVSTVGLPKQIRMLASEELQLNLALSLHAVRDDLRAELIPWGRGVSIAELIAACRDYFKATGREITLEYVLLDRVNMSREDARELARIARDLRANVNLLRYNPVSGLPYDRPSSKDSFAFQKQLREQGVNAHIRTSRGRDVAAACGQLRRSAQKSAG